MRWPALAVGLVLACVGLGAWIWLRDYDANTHLPPGDAAVRRARNVLAGFGPRPGCPSCRVEILRGGTLARITGQQGTRCFALDPAALRGDSATGIAGVRARPCP